MGEVDRKHRPLLSGVRIWSGIREGLLNRVRGIHDGTLTGLATRNNDNKLVLVTNMHNMSSLLTAGEFQNPVGTEEMFQGYGRDSDDKVGDGLRYYSVTDGKLNTADVATLDLEDGVGGEFAMHSAPPDPHTSRLIIEGVIEPENGMTLTMLGGFSGEREGTVIETGRIETIRGKTFSGLVRLDCGDSAPIVDGDSGAPCLYKVRDGVYRMAGIMFASREESRFLEGERVTHQIAWLFPASVAQSVMGITFGVKLENLDPAEQSGFTPALYSGWEAVTDFSGETLGLDAIETHGTSAHWLGTAIPSTAGTVRHRWWQTALVAVSNVPIGVQLTIHGGPDTHPWFTAGQVWGFRVYIKRTTDSEWQQVLAGSDILSAADFTSGSDEKALAVAEFTVPITSNAERWLEYFKPYRRDSTGGDFEVKIEGAPVNRAPIAKVVAKPNPAVPGTRVTLDASASTDPDGDRITKYKWTQVNPVAETLVTLTDSDKAKAYFDAPSTAGTLTFKATATDIYNESGEARVDVTVAPAGIESLGALTRSVRVTGRWTDDVLSVNRSGSYARYYAFRLEARATVVISLWSGQDPYLFLLADAGKDGRVLDSNNDYIGSQSRITRTLDAGYYTIEATTHSAGRTVYFKLDVTALSNDATLSALGLSAGELTPAFAVGETSYTASVGHAQDTIRVTPTASHGSATIAVNGVATASGSESVALSLLVGENAVNVVVTAEDGAKKTYTITVTRAELGATTPDEDDTAGGGGSGDDDSPETGNNDEGEKGDDDDEDCTEWTDTGHTRGTGADREKKQTRTCGGEEEERWVPDPCTEWSKWKETGKTRGGGGTWEAEEKRTRTCGAETEEQFRWVDTEPPVEVWPDEWTDTGEHRGEGVEREKRQKKTSNLGNVKYQWAPDPDPDPQGLTPTRPTTPTTPTRPTTPTTPTPTRPTTTPTPTRRTTPEPETWPDDWTDTGAHRGEGMEREKQQEQTSSRGRKRYQWVPDPVTPLTPVTPPKETWGRWGNWYDVGGSRGSGQNREKQQMRTRRSNLGNRQNQTRWVPDPVTPTWGPWSGWSDTGAVRGSGVESEKEQSRTRTRTDGETETQKRWVPNV